MTTPIYPDITVKITGEDGNAFNIMGKVRTAMRRDGVAQDQFLKYQAEATSGDYDNLLQVTMKWVNVE